jgi:hypothetical protein
MDGRGMEHPAPCLPGLGETETALHWLGQAFQDRDVHMTFLLDHKWGGMRSNAEFQKLLSRVGFARS